MKNIIKISLLAALMVITVVSCDLDRYPYDSIEQTQAFESMTDAASLRNGLYAQFRGRSNGYFQFVTDLQVDYFNATLDFGNNYGTVHKWTFVADDYYLQYLWEYPYNSIANINNFIDNIGSVTTEDDADAETISQYLGEAYLLRAYYYHGLVMRYAKAYDPSTASSDLGVPVVLTYDVALKPERATVAAVYAQILSDLDEAKTLLADVPGEPCSEYLTIDCVYALQARVYLCMENYTAAATAAEHLISLGTYPLVDNLADMEAMWINDAGSEVLFQPYCSTSELPNAYGYFLFYNATSGKYDPYFVPEQWVIDLYDDNDIRKPVYFGHESDIMIAQGLDYTGIYLMTKFAGNPDLWTGSTSNYYQAPKPFRIAEDYLISAEAYAQSTSTEGQALGRLNDLRVARGLATISVTGTALRDSIRVERTRELIGEGFRLDDLKRWDLGFARSTPQNSDLISTGAEFEQLSKSAGADKFVWGIPSNDVTANPNIQQNTGW